MTISITIIHNKSDLENEAQITHLLSLVTKIPTATMQDQFDEEGNLLGQEEFTTYHYEFNDLKIPHIVKFYQIIPFGVTPPSNKDLLDSYKVFYGFGDEDKVGDHPRFFNWGLKRGTDHGAEVSVYLDSPKALDLDSLAVAVNSLADPDDKHEFVEDTSMKVSSLKLLQEVGQLDESKSLTQAITSYKTKLSKEGLKYG